MAQFNGYTGQVMIGAVVVAELDEWDLNIDAKLIDKTIFGNTWVSNRPGLKSWNGKAKGRWDMTDTNGQLALQNAQLGGTSVSLKLYPNATNYYSGTAYIKGIAAKAAVAGLSEVEFNFEGDGAVAMT